MADAPQSVEVPQGVFISSSVIYNLIIQIDNRLIRVEEEQKNSKPDSARIRVIEKQIAALWVLYGIMLAVVASNVVRILTP